MTEKIYVDSKDIMLYNEFVSNIPYFQTKKTIKQKTETFDDTYECCQLSEFIKILEELDDRIGSTWTQTYKCV